MTDQVIEHIGVRGYLDDKGTAQLNVEDVARGLGFTQKKNETVYVRWETVSGYLKEFGFSQQVGKDDFIPENIFYRLAMKAKNDTGEIFQAKVADEILPAIRKHGGYLTPAKVEEVLLNPDTIIQLATQLKAARAEKDMLANQIEKQQPLVDFAELCMQSDKAIKVREFAHMLTSHGVKIGERRLFDKLREWKYIEKVGTEPTQRSTEQGLFEVATGVKQKPSGEPFTWRVPYVTVKGQAHIANRLKKELELGAG